MFGRKEDEELHAALSSPLPFFEALVCPSVRLPPAPFQRWKIAASSSSSFLATRLDCGLDGWMDGGIGGERG